MTPKEQEFVALAAQIGLRRAKVICALAGLLEFSSGMERRFMEFGAQIDKLGPEARAACVRFGRGEEDDIRLWLEEVCS